MALTQQMILEKLHEIAAPGGRMSLVEAGAVRGIEVDDERLAEQAIEPLLRAAESQADPDARIRFRYDWLRQDLERVRSGIEEHLHAPRAEPRSFPPLRGDYRR